MMSAMRSFSSLRPRLFSRGLRTAQPKGAAEAASASDSIIASDTVASMLALHHKINYALIALTPVALVLSPSALSMPFDIALGIVLPIHSHISMNMVITDYAKKIFGKGAILPARYAMLAVTGTTLLGLAKLNLSGPGITATIKSFWRPKAA